MKAVGSYLQKGFQKGVPSLFQSVKFLYATPEKVSCVFIVYKLIIDLFYSTCSNN